MQQLKEVFRKQAEIDNKARLDLGDEERKKKLEELAAESDPLTRLMNDILGDKVLEGDVSDPVSWCVAVLMLLGSGLTWTRPPDWGISPFNVVSHLISSWSA